MINKQLISILIPTKNREEYALKIIQLILEIRDNRFQLIIQDNSNTDVLMDLLNSKGLLDDERIEYYYYEKSLSFVENFSIGLSKCKGEYVTIIGDDDAINPKIIDVVEWASRKNIQAITPTLPFVYYWPQSGVNSLTDSGRLTISNFTCKVKYYDTSKELKKLLNDGCQNYLDYKLAKVYHGIVKRSILEDIQQITGSFVGGLSPDIYLSVAVSAIIDKVLVIDYPLTISGICKKSGSADSATGRHTGALKDAPHFRGHSAYIWSDKIPEFYSVETIWGDSAISAINDINPALSESFRVEVVTAYCLMNYHEYRSVIFRNLYKNFNISKQSLQVPYLLITGYLNGPCKNLFKRIVNRLMRRSKVLIIDDVVDIKSALYLIQKQDKMNIGNNNIMNNLYKIKIN